MLRKYPILKWSLITLFGLVASIVSFVFWFKGLIPTGEERTKLNSLDQSGIYYLEMASEPKKGKILAVVTSTSTIGEGGESTGYELTELARAYYVFQSNGFEVHIASTKGGEPPVVIDKGDMGPFDFAFLEDAEAQNKVKHSLVIDEVDPDQYDAMYFAGGKGAVFDFPENNSIKSMVAKFIQEGKVVGAVCHGPAALVNVKMPDGSPLVENREISCFTNEEELFLIPDAADVFPFLLEDELESRGAKIVRGNLYLNQVSVDKNLVTGQNPWSTWSTAEAMIRQMGITPLERPVSAEENVVDILSIYEKEGYTSARSAMTKIFNSSNPAFDRTLLAVHSIVAAMQWEVGKAKDLLRLVVYAKKMRKRNQESF